MRASIAATFRAADISHSRGWHIHTHTHISASAQRYSRSCAHIQPYVCLGVTAAVVALRESKSNLKLKWANVVKAVRFCCCCYCCCYCYIGGSILSMVIFYEKGFMAFNYAALFEYCACTYIRSQIIFIKNRAINLAGFLFSCSALYYTRIRDALYYSRAAVISGEKLRKYLAFPFRY